MEKKKKTIHLNLYGQKTYELITVLAGQAHCYTKYRSSIKRRSIDPDNFKMSPNGEIIYDFSRITWISDRWYEPNTFKNSLGEFLRTGILESLELIDEFSVHQIMTKLNPDEIRSTCACIGPSAKKLVKFTLRTACCLCDYFLGKTEDHLIRTYGMETLNDIKGKSNDPFVTASLQAMMISLDDMNKKFLDELNDFDAKTRHERQEIVDRNMVTIKELQDKISKMQLMSA